MIPRAGAAGSLARHDRSVSGPITPADPSTPAPPSSRRATPVDRLVEVPHSTAAPYGQGVWRRRIRVVNVDERCSIGELEDDVHHFRVELYHDGRVITDVVGRGIRSPWTTCTEAVLPLRAIVGHPLADRSDAIGAYADARKNCTHLFDTAGLTLAHVRRATQQREYDIEMTDPPHEGGPQRVTVWRDGAFVLSWVVQDFVVLAPDEWTDAPLRRKFIAWANERLDPDLAEAAFLAKRGVEIGQSRKGDMDRWDVSFDGPAPIMMGSCHTFSPEVAPIALRRKGTTRHFGDHPEILLSDMHLRPPSKQPGTPSRLVIGLTGGIGTGKSTVAGLLATRGAVVVDCDGLGRKVVEPDGRAYAAVVERFGPGVVAADGRIDRPALAAIVFNDADALADLNAITHPAIDAEIADAIAATAPDAVVVLDMAVLTESNLGKGQYGPVLVVQAPLDVRLERLAQRGLSADDAKARIASQASDLDRRRIADVLIDNGGDLDALDAQVERAWQVLTAGR